MKLAWSCPVEITTTGRSHSPFTLGKKKSDEVIFVFMYKIDEELEH